MTKNTTVKITYSAIFLALAMVLPLVTGQIHQIGNALCPMHIPVLLCGFICGWQYGAIVGFVSPFLRFVLFGMPTVFPKGIGMAFELCAYGIIAGLVFMLLQKKRPSFANVYITLITAMLGGRIVWGMTRFILAKAVGIDFTLAYFFAEAFTNALPGIVLHILLIPIIVIALQKAKLIP